MLRREDLVDADIIDRTELEADGLTIFKTSTIVSTTTGTKVVVIDNTDSQHNLLHTDTPVEDGDFLTIPSGDAAGTYTVASVTNDNTLVVVEPIATSVGGSAEFIHSAGAFHVGVDNTTLVNTSIPSNLLSEVVQQFDAALSPQVNSFDEATYSGNKLTTFIVWTDAGKTQKKKETQLTYTGNQVTQSINIEYDETGTELYRTTEVLTYTGSSVADITRTRT